jgi:hypothetical protein
MGTLMELKLMACRIFTKCLHMLFIACIFATFLQQGLASDIDGSNLVDEARALLKAVKPEDTSYIHKNNIISWGVDAKAVCHADCSGLINALLLHCKCFSEDQLTKNLGSNRPLAKHYHDAIIHHRGFKEITKIDEVRPGDIIAIKYPPGSGNTGHVMLVAAVPLKRNPTEPLIKNSIQYEIEIIDSTSSGHGASDSRRIESGKYREGLGKGVYRVFSDDKGIFIGHTWSVYPTSKYYEMTVRNLVIGRINP